MLRSAEIVSPWGTDLTAEQIRRRPGSLVMQWKTRSLVSAQT